MLVYGYIVGKHFREKAFPTFEDAAASMQELQAQPHDEKIMWVISERQLSEKEQLMLNAVQTERRVYTVPLENR